MDNKEFKKWREKLKKTQKEIAELLSVSLKDVQGYEQGWQNIPVHVERLIYFHLSTRDGNQIRRKPCWVIKNCPLKSENSVRHGNLMPVIFAGLLAEPFAVVMTARSGRRKLSSADLVRF